MNHQSILKTVIISLILTVATSSSFAQSAQTELEIIQDAFGLEKKVAVANFMELGESAERFWEIYDEYEAERKELGKERIQVIADYAESYPTISDEEIRSLFKRTKAFKRSFAKLQKTYFNRMSKEVGTSQAAQFWQLESYFNAMIQAEIYSQIPFIGENLNGN
jgi:hypothetical protein